MSENSSKGSRVGVTVLTLILIITSIAFIKIISIESVRGYECGYSQARCDFSNEVDKKINCEAVPDRCYQFIKTKK